MPHLSRQDKRLIEEAAAKQGGDFNLKRFMWEKMAETAAPPRVQQLGIVGDDLFDEMPVNFTTFMSDFFGESSFEGPQTKLALAMFGEEPKIWDTTYQEAIALWGMGSGKDWLIRKLVLYAAYWIICLRNPQEFFNQGRGETLDIANFSVNAQSAQNIFFRGLKRDIKNVVCPEWHKAAGQRWFETWGMILKEGSEGGHLKSSEIIFPKSVRAFSLHSEKYSFEGMNIILAILDEIAEFALGVAKDIHEGVRDNITSRFGKMGKCFLLSYKRHDYDYMMIRYREAETEDDVYVSGPFATWEVNKRRKKSDFKAKFLKNPKRARRVYMCEGSGQNEEERFFSYPKKISSSINRNRSNPVAGNLSFVELSGPNSIRFKEGFHGDPHKVYSLHLDLAGAKGENDCAALCLGHAEEATDAVDIQEKAFLKELLRGEDGAGVEGIKRGMEAHPRLDPNSIKEWNFRPVKADETAEDVMERIQKIYSRDLVDYSRKVVIDLYLQMRGANGHELQLQHVEDLISVLIKELNFSLGIVTADQWQSKQLLQNLTRAGIRAERRSTKNDNEAHNTVKSLIYTGMLDYYENTVFVREAQELIEVDGKIDHPERSKRRESEEGRSKGSSDVWESVVGCVQGCFELPFRRSTNVLMGTIVGDD